MTIAKRDRRIAIEILAAAVLTCTSGIAYTQQRATGVKVVRDVAYGSDARQKFDVYIPANAKKAPVILLVHGGAARGNPEISAAAGAKPGWRQSRSVARQWM